MKEYSENRFVQVDWNFLSENKVVFYWYKPKFEMLPRKALGDGTYMQGLGGFKNSRQSVIGWTNQTSVRYQAVVEIPEYLRVTERIKKIL